MALDMNSFGAVTERIRHTHKLIRDRVIQTDAERALIITESRKRNESGTSDLLEYFGICTR